MRKFIFRSGAGIALVTLSAISVFAQAEVKQSTAKAKIIRDIEYGHLSGESQKLDLYLPETESTSPVPAMVFVHGGGWVGGDKREYESKAIDLAGRGYVSVSVNYRMAPKHKFPAAVEDVQRAVRWLRSHAVEYHVDRRKIASMGGSAGGHLATMLGVTDEPGREGDGPVVSSRVLCVVDYYGRMDLTIDPTSDKHEDFRERFMGSLPDGNQETLRIYRQASPLYHVDKLSAPMLIVQGGVDQQVEPIQSDRMFHEMQKMGIKCWYLKLSGQGHGFSGEAADFAWSSAVTFLRKNFNEK
ncbi:MAG: alpha/beta hydrolase [Chthonomonadales bacterium]